MRILSLIIFASVVFLPGSVTFADSTLQTTSSTSQIENPGYLLLPSYAQQFTATESGTFSVIKASLCHDTPVSQVYLIEVMADSSDLPSGISLASASFNQNSLTTTCGNPGIEFTLSQPVTIASSTKYWIIVHQDTGTFPTYGTSASSYIAVGGNSGDVYSGGIVKRYYNGSWATRTQEWNISVLQVASGGSDAATSTATSTLDIATWNAVQFNTLILFFISVGFTVWILKLSI